MLYLPNDEMFANKFVHVELPTKSQIFSRTGQRSVSPAGSYTGDSSANFGKTPSESAMEFVATAESSKIESETEKTE